jgi:hypothetical protein
MLGITCHVLASVQESSNAEAESAPDQQQGEADGAASGPQEAAESASEELEAAGASAVSSAPEVPAPPYEYVFGFLPDRRRAEVLAATAREGVGPSQQLFISSDAVSTPLQLILVFS